MVPTSKNKTLKMSACRSDDAGKTQFGQGPNRLRNRSCREKGDRGGRDVCSENNNKAWEPVDLFLSFLRSKEKCTQFELKQ